MRLKIAFTVIFILCFTGLSFGADEAFDQTHSAWTMVLQETVKDGRIDYIHLKRNPEKLEKYIESLGELDKDDYQEFTVNEKMAYWVNFYNAATVYVVMKNYPIYPKKPNPQYPKSSIRQIEGAWTEYKFETPFGKLNINQIDFEKLRKFREPMINFVICDSTVSSSRIPSTAVTGDNLETTMVEATRDFVLDSNNVRAEPNTKILFLSPLFRLKGEQFVHKYYRLGHFKHRTKAEISVLILLNQYAGMMEKMMILQDDFKIEYMKYDWSLNER